MSSDGVAWAESFVVGVSELAAHLVTSRQHAHQMTRQVSFPAPLARLKMGPVWWRRDVDKWVAGRRGG